VADPSGVRALDVAVRAGPKLGTRCRWVGRVRVKVRACNAPAWIRAGLEPAGSGRWTWQVRLGTRLTGSGYVITFRAVDSLGNWAADRARIRDQSSR
jgi:hypothetical protein